MDSGEKKYNQTDYLIIHLTETVSTYNDVG